MKTLKQLSTILPVIAVLTVFTVASLVLAQRSSAGGYGYGTCTAVAPTELKAKPKVTATTTAVLRWTGVDFTDCGSHSTTASYTVKIYRAEGGVVKTYTGVTAAQLAIAKGVLKPNSNYKYKVKAFATDSTASAWSVYKLFHTLPAKVKHVAITNVTSGSADVTWKNVARSKTLKYYQVTVRQGNKVVFISKVTKGLNQTTSTVTATGLTSDTKYTVRVRAVYTKKNTGKAGSAVFTTAEGNTTVIL